MPSTGVAALEVAPCCENAIFLSIPFFLLHPEFAAILHIGHPFCTPGLFVHVGVIVVKKFLFPKYCAGKP